MIYLIGGSSHVGKTLLSQKLMERTNYPYTSLDHLKMGFIRSGMTELTVEDDDEFRDWMWPFVVGMIKTAIENKQNMIIEGCYIPVEWKKSFCKEERVHIKSLFVVMSEMYIRKHFSDIVNYANAIEQRIDDNPNMESLISCSANFQKLCELHGEPCYVIEQVFDVDDMIKKVMGLAE